MIEFDRLPLILKRYSFESKMSSCYLHAIELMDLYGLELLKNGGKPYPWELELFALLSVLSINEYNEHDMRERNFYVFSQIINCIRNYKPRAWDDLEKENLIHTFMRIAGQTQFEYQKDFRLKFYRYDYIFTFKNSNIDMSMKFVELFGVEYKYYRQFAFSLYEYLVQAKIHKNKNFTPIMLFLYKKYEIVLDHLIIDRLTFS